MESITEGRHSGKKGRFYRNRTLFPPQAHTLWEIILILEGTGYTQLGDQRYPFNPGTLICVPPYLVHQNVPDDYYSDYCIGIQTPILPGHAPYLFQDDRDQTFFHLIKLYDHVNTARPVNYESILTSLESVIQNILICWSKRQPNAEMLKLTQLLRENHADPEFRASDAIAQIPMNADYLRKQFRELYGSTPGAYLNALRIETACKHLIQTDLPIGEISLHVGFADAKYFARVFRAQIGLPPLKYREKNRARKATQIP